MYKWIILFISLFFYMNTFAAVGKHNFSLNIGGGFDYLQTATNPNLKFLGGGTNFELGYMYYNANRSVICGVDTRYTFSTVFSKLSFINNYTAKYLDTNLSLLNAQNYFGTTFQLGQQKNYYKIMFDLLGMNLGCDFIFGISKLSNNQGILPSYIGRYLIVGMNLPIGFQLVTDSGFVFGFRHKLDFLISTGSFNLFKEQSGETVNFLNYSMYLSIGFIVGK